MPEINILTESELKAAISLDATAVQCIEDAFRTLADGKVVMPPILSMAIHEHNGEVDVKTAYVPGVESFAVKISPGFFDNPKLGLPSTSGMMNLFSARTGTLEAVLLDNGYLTDVRTAAAGAVAAKHLSRKNSSVATIFGAGTQARLQLQALTLVRPITKAFIWGRDFDRATATAQELTATLGIEVNATHDAEMASAAADVIVTTTPSTTPLVKADWLKGGQHVTAMGSDQPDKGELEPECLIRATRYVADREAQCRLAGELHRAIESGVATENFKVTELCDVIAGRRPGRDSDDDLTIADLTGTGLQDTAIATLARQRVLAADAGTVIDS